MGMALIYHFLNRKNLKRREVRVLADKNNTIRISKFLSLVLRHRPEKIGLQLDASGWADVDDLLQKANRAGVRLDRELLEYVVATNDKKRFSFSQDGTRIRANQGHSIPVDLGLSPVSPPPELYHGTVERFLERIRSEGLLAQNRNYVHLSKDRETAEKVGQRRGKPVILIIPAGRMHGEGYKFFLSENGVWLTAKVPAEYIIFP
jgi:putative RNA 2'-phosphotransferase